jgi:hypothetical protein
MFCNFLHTASDVPFCPKFKQLHQRGEIIFFQILTMICLLQSLDKVFSAKFWLNTVLNKIAFSVTYFLSICHLKSGGEWSSKSCWILSSRGHRRATPAMPPWWRQWPCAGGVGALVVMAAVGSNGCVMRRWPHDEVPWWGRWAPTWWGWWAPVAASSHVVSAGYGSPADGGKIYRGRQVLTTTWQVMTRLSPKSRVQI